MPLINKASLKEELFRVIREKAVDPKVFDFTQDSLGPCVVFNTESVHFFIHSDEYRAYVKSCRHLFLDGAALQLYLRMNGIYATRFHGPDLLSLLLRKGYFGSNQLVLVGSDQTIEAYSKVAPISSGVPVPYFGLDEVEQVVSEIDVEADAAFLKSTVIICLGLPKQELFAAQLRKRFSGRENFSILPLGAAIDFATGAKRRSSSFWTSIGLEWLPRLIREPRMVTRLIRSFQALVQLQLGVRS